MLAIGALLVSFLGVIMKKTQPVTRLRAVTDALFTNALFGVEATKLVVEELCSKFISTEQREIFKLWKIIRAIDLCMAGSLNYNGVETRDTLFCGGAWAISAWKYTIPLSNTMSSICSALDLARLPIH